MEDTDGKWLRMIVYDTWRGHVDVVQILHSTCNTPGWQRYILMAFRLVVAGSGRDLKSIHIDELGPA